jgi:hypothetical protein
MEAGILDTWSQARRRGETVALMANRVDTVARLNQLAQQTRIRNGELDPTGPNLRIGDQRVLAGDEVVTRRNDRTLRTDRGLIVKNRDHWTVETILSDRSVTLVGRTGTVLLPAVYVSEHLELGYAQTSHATQGRTVDTGLLLLDAPTDSRGVYTPMTRGRNSNHAYVVTGDNRTAVDVLTLAVTRDWIDQPAIARRTELESRHHEPPLWPSLQADHRSVPEPGPVAEMNHDPTRSVHARNDEHDAEARRRRLIEEHLAAIQERRRTIGRNPDRDGLGIGR